MCKKGLFWVLCIASILKNILRSELDNGPTPSLDNGPTPSFCSLNFLIFSYFFWLNVIKKVLKEQTFKFCQVVAWQNWSCIPQIPTNGLISIWSFLYGNLDTEPSYLLFTPKAFLRNGFCQFTAKFKCPFLYSALFCSLNLFFNLSFNFSQRLSKSIDNILHFYGYF